MIAAWNKGKKLKGPCEICGNNFQITNKWGNRRKTCSIKCTNKLRSQISKRNGSRPPSRLGVRVKGAKRRYKTKQGYIVKTDGDTWRQYEHRIVVEKNLRRSLKTTEHIHHKNNKRDDNRVENLEIVDIKEHNKYHIKERNDLGQFI